jgi:DUF971 family protein
LEAIQDAMAAKHRFELTSHLLRMIGICADCRKKGSDRKRDSPKQTEVKAATRGAHR